MTWDYARSAEDCRSGSHCDTRGASPPYRRFARDARGTARGTVSDLRRVCFGRLRGGDCLDGNLDGQTTVLSGMLVSDPFNRLGESGRSCPWRLFTILLSVRATFTEHVGEYVALLLLATVGMMFMVSSEELLTIFAALELTSLSLYILTAFHKQSLQSAEAALKYFLFGGMSAAFTLFGLSLIYGLTGSTSLRPIADALHGQPMHPLLIAAIVMTLVGFGFKVAAAPFHLWAPDAYQGAPVPSAALIASGSKVASFYLFSRNSHGRLCRCGREWRLAPVLAGVDLRSGHPGGAFNRCSATWRPWLRAMSNDCWPIPPSRMAAMRCSG